MATSPFCPLPDACRLPDARGVAVGTRHEDLNAVRFRTSFALLFGLVAAVQANWANAAFVAGIGIPQRSAPAAVLVILKDLASVPGTIQVSVEVTPVPSIGDIRAVYFHILDESLLDGLSASGSDVTDSRFAANSVRSFSQGTHINPHGDFDMGFEIGTVGIEPDDIQFTTFVLSHATLPLTVQQFEFQDFGVRLTHVGPAGTRRSYLTFSKLTGVFSRAIPEPSAAPLGVYAIAMAIGRRGRRRSR